MYVSCHCSVYHHFIVGNWKMGKSSSLLCNVVCMRGWCWELNPKLPSNNQSRLSICRQTPDYATTAFQHGRKNWWSHSVNFHVWPFFHSFFNYILHPAGGGISCWYPTPAQILILFSIYPQLWISFISCSTYSFQQSDKGCRFGLCRHDLLILFLLVFRIKSFFKLSLFFLFKGQWSGLILNSMYPTHCKDLKHTKLPIPFLLHLYIPKTWHLFLMEITWYGTQFLLCKIFDIVFIFCLLQLLQMIQLCLKLCFFWGGGCFWECTWKIENIEI